MKSQRARINYLVLAVISLSFFSTNLSQATSMMSVQPSNKAQCLSQIELVFSPVLKGENPSQLKIDSAKIREGLKPLSYAQCLDYWKRNNLASTSLALNDLSTNLDKAFPDLIPSFIDIKYPSNKNQCTAQLRAEKTKEMLGDNSAGAKTDLLVSNIAVSVMSYSNCLKYFKLADASKLDLVVSDVTSIDLEITFLTTPH